MLEAMYKVIRNKGSHGVDNMKADDCNIYVKSKRAGEMVMKSITNIIENELKLKVNRNKSNVDLVSRRKFLGFSFYFAEGGAKIRIHEKSIRRFKDKIREITNKNKGISMDYRLIKLNDMIIGWVNYFKIANASRKLIELDKWIRRRLRACMWKQWKKVRTRYRILRKLKLEHWRAIKLANSRCGYWRMAEALNTVLTKKIIAKLGYTSMLDYYLIVYEN